MGKKKSGANRRIRELRAELKTLEAQRKKENHNAGMKGNALKFQNDLRKK